MCLVRCFPLLLLILAWCRGENIIEAECGFIEKTDRGMQCEFNNIFTLDESTEFVITETNRLIDAVSFRQSQLFSVPADLFQKFSQLKHLDVELTEMKKISASSFQNASSLKYFLARFNDIAEIKSKTFVSCPLLKFIVLQYNQITNIEANAFDGLENLEALYLDYNKLTSLSQGLLNSLTSLIHFSMAYNNLTFIPDGLFVNNDKLETLNLGHNQLTSFNDNQFTSLPNLERVQLDHNKLTKLNLRDCKSTEINVDNNQIETLELNKWTRVVSAWNNPVKKFSLHEHYGTGRNYNFSFAQVNEITFFVNEHCCSKENLENFHILTQSFGDLSEKLFDVNDWRCEFLKTIGYESPQGLVVNNVCKKLSQDFVTESRLESTTSWTYTMPTRTTTVLPRSRIYNQEDFIESDELPTTVKPRESMEDLSLSPNIFTGLDIETLAERRTTTELNVQTAFVQELFPTTTESYEKKCEKGILKTVKVKVSGWKDKVVRKWNDWVG